MIKIINYGLGNVKAFYNIYKSLGIECEICESPESIQDAIKLILPGVGSFDWAMYKLNNSGMREILDKLVLEKKIPILGICIGMQIMMEQSEEGKEKGLSWIKGNNLHLSINNSNELKYPHMGWNNIEFNDNFLFKNIVNPNFYFLHSYHVELHNNCQAEAYAKYGKKFTCAFSNNDNIFGVQFHPEKSHSSGVKLLENFSNL